MISLLTWEVIVVCLDGESDPVSETKPDCDGIGINMISVNDINIYPNPTTGELTITNYELGITSIEVFDIYGKNLLSNHLITSSSNHHINISHLPTGMYFVKIHTETGVVVRKVVKE